MRPPVKRLEIAGKLKKEILSGAYANRNRLPVEPELAAMLGITRKTLRGSLDILEKEGLLERIPGKGTFLPHRTGSDVGNVFLLLPCSDYFLKSDFETRSILRDILSGCLQEACLRKAHVITLPLTTTNRIEDFDETILERLPDGSRIIFYSNWYAPIFPLFLRKKFRIAHIHHLNYRNSSLKQAVDQWVCCKADLAGGIEKALDYLVQRGASRIALATSFLNNEFNPVRSAYLRALENLPGTHPQLLCDIGGINEPPMAFVERLRKFQKETAFDGLLFGVHDSPALNFAHSLNSNLGLPEKTSLVTLFPYDFNNKYTPCIPSVKFDYLSIGVFAVQSLFQDHYTPQEIVFSPILDNPAEEPSAHCGM